MSWLSPLPLAMTLVLAIAGFLVPPAGASTVDRVDPGDKGDGETLLLVRDSPLRGQFRGPASEIADVDGDGVADLAIGMPEVDFGELQFSRVVVCSGASGRVIWGTDGVALNDRLGAALDVVGDLDADGLDDVAAGAPFTLLLGFENAGAVRILSGRDGRTIWNWLGEDAAALFGSAVKGCGDLDIDGVVDVAVGAPESSVGLSRGGAVYAYSGRTGAVIWRATASAGSAGLGTSLTTVPDLDSDGIPEVAAGMPRLGITSDGGVAILSGARGDVVLDIGSPLSFSGFGASLASLTIGGASWLVVGAPFARNVNNEPVGAVSVVSLQGGFLATLLGATDGSEFGSSVATGDLDVDGVADLAVGARFETDSTGARAGAVRTYLSSQGFGAQQIPASSVGEQFGQFLEIASSGALIVGSPRTSYPGSNIAGSVKILTSGGTLLKEFAGTSAAAGLGTNVAAIGDLDADGFDEFVVAAPSANHGEEIFEGEARLYSGRQGILLLTVEGDSPFQFFGSTVAAAGDVNLDGLPDFAVGAPLADNSQGSNSGFVELYSGSGAPIRRFEGEQFGQEFGRAIASVGDLDGDGVPDFAIGAPNTRDATQQVLGMARVVSGATGVKLAQCFGEVESGQFGTSLTALPNPGPVGGCAVIVGAPSGVYRGLTSPGFIYSWDPAKATPSWSLAGSEPGAAFGWSVSGGMDLDADGLPEIVAGAPNTGDGYGSLTLLDARGEVRWTREGADENGELGSAVALSADLDGDGLGEVIGGAPGATVVGWKFVPPGVAIAGTGAGVVNLWNVKGEAIATVHGAVGGGAFGSSVAAIGRGPAASSSTGGAPALLVGAPIEASNGVVRAIQFPAKP